MAVESGKDDKNRILLLCSMNFITKCTGQWRNVFEHLGNLCEATVRHHPDLCKDNL